MYKLDVQSPYIIITQQLGMLLGDEKYSSLYYKQNECFLVGVLGFYRNLQLQGCTHLQNAQFATNLGMYEAR